MCSACALFSCRKTPSQTLSINGIRQTILTLFCSKKSTSQYILYIAHLMKSVFVTFFLVNKFCNKRMEEIHTRDADCTRILPHFTKMHSNYVSAELTTSYEDNNLPIAADQNEKGRTILGSLKTLMSRIERVPRFLHSYKERVQLILCSFYSCLTTSKK